jgi:hypothetical protein
MPANHRQTLQAMLACRTGDAGIAVYGCDDCPDRRVVPLGCGNRHCPNCQHDKSQQWLHRAMNKVLPGPHFMVTFTVPEELRRFFRSNQRLCYGALFNASSGALKGALANAKHCGAEHAGFFGVLHTWSRQMEYHPHLHYVVPGGGLDPDTGLWQPTAPNFLVPARTLSKLAKAKFKDAMRQAGALDQIPDRVWRRDWVVDVQAVGNNVEGVVKYLAPYVFRVAVSDSRIVADDNGLITVSYQPSGSKETRHLNLRAFEFLRRFLLHVLPKGFMKIRYYGFMSSACRIPRDEIAAMIALADSDSPVLAPKLPESPPANTREPMTCPCCGKEQRLLSVWINDRCVFKTRPLNQPLKEKVE